MHVTWISNYILCYIENIFYTQTLGTWDILCVVLIIFNNFILLYAILEWMCSLDLELILYLFLWGISSYSRIFHSLPLPVKGCKIDLCSALHWALEQWGFFSMPNLLLQGASVYNGHVRGPMTFTHIAERLAVEL